MGSDPRLTSAVVLCTYNGVRFLKEQLDSILNQTPRVDRVYILDDGSTDGTWELLNELYASLDTVTLTRNPANLGYVKNFEKGLSLVREDVVFFADQDDIWRPGKVAAYLSCFSQKDEVCLVFGDLALIDEEGHDLGTTLWVKKGFWDPASGKTLLFEDQKRTMASRNVVTGASMAMRTRAAQSWIPFPEGMPHDHYLALRTAASGGLVEVLDQPWGFYRLHAGQTLGAGNLPPKRSKDWSDRIYRLERKIQPLLQILKTQKVVDRLLEASLKKQIRKLRSERRKAQYKRFVLWVNRHG